jgi:hypothetical protein
LEEGGRRKEEGGETDGVLCVRQAAPREGRLEEGGRRKEEGGETDGVLCVRQAAPQKGRLKEGGRRKEARRTVCCVSGRQRRRRDG